MVMMDLDCVQNIRKNSCCGYEHGHPAAMQAEVCAGYVADVLLKRKHPSICLNVRRRANGMKKAAIRRGFIRQSNRKTRWRRAP